MTNFKLNIPNRVRAAIYVLATLGSPIMAYLLAKGIVGELEMGLWAALTTAVTTMAALNTPNNEQ